MQHEELATEGPKYNVVTHRNVISKIKSGYDVTVS